MKRSVWAAIALAVTVVATSRGQQEAPPPAPEYVPGELLVLYARTATNARKNTVLSGRRARLLRRYDQIDSDRVQIASGESIADAIQAFRANADVAAVQPNYVRHIVATSPPNDPRWLNDSLWGLIRVQAQNAWNTLGARGNGSVVIMDIDTGINYNHEDLAANVWTNPNDPVNGLDDDNDGYIDDVHGINTITGSGNPADDNGHGTHTAGTMAAVGNNGVGVVGVNWNAKILACKFLTSSGTGTDGDAAECVNYAVLLKTQKGVNIRVTNNSWGGYGGDPSVLQNAFTAAANNGIISFAAAGNDGRNIDLQPNVFYPADLSTVVPNGGLVAVASMDSTENKSSFSNYGPTHVSLMAPGSGIWSTVTGPNNNEYASFSGTSMATPHVAGTAALLSSLDPALTVAQLRAIITTNVDVFTQYGNYVTTGGRLNVFRAASAVAPPPPQYTLTPSPLSLNSGSPLAIGWTAPSGHSTSDWLGLYRVGDPNSAYLWWTYVGGATSGTSNLTAPSQAGQYEFRYLLNNGYQDAARSAALTVTQPQGGTYSLTPSPLSVPAGGPLTIAWTAPAGRPSTDWIGLYHQSGGSYVWWVYTGGATSGSVNLTAPSSPDTYVFHYFLQNGFTEAAVSPAVTVTGGQQVPITISASPASASPGAQLTATWTAPPGRPSTDWIGLYRVGDPNTSYLWWQYTQGTQSGSAGTTAPATNGQYEFRYLTQDSYNLAATSNAISVVGAAAQAAQMTLMPHTPLAVVERQRR